MTNQLPGYCGAAGHPIHGPYHDQEYGFPVVDDDGLFERLVLEINQAGLSWLTILKKREGFRRAYDGFTVERVAEALQEDLSLHRRGDRRGISAEHRVPARGARPGVPDLCARPEGQSGVGRPLREGFRKGRPPGLNQLARRASFTTTVTGVSPAFRI